jgi:hypothetical protein
VLVRGLPPAFLLGEPNGGTHPNVGLLAVRPLSGDVVEAGGERRPVACRDAQIVHFKAEGSLERREPLGKFLSVHIHSPVHERGREII